MNKVLDELPLPLLHWHPLFMKVHLQDHHQMDSRERVTKLGIFRDIYESMENIDDITLFLISCARFEIEKYKYIYIYIL